MALKRTYQVASPYTRGSKRARTLTSQVNQLKRQVASNKKELKYYDGFIQVTETGSLDQSLLTNVFDSGGVSDNPTFVGRKIYLRKLELRFPTASNAAINNAMTLYREKRTGKSVGFGVGPTNIDPEYHTLLRYHERQFNSDKLVNMYNISFGQQGRLVEFDDQTTATASGTVVSGDVKMIQNINTGAEIISFRMWYTDG